jgi:hypothetical protein
MFRHDQKFLGRRRAMNSVDIPEAGFGGGESLPARAPSGAAVPWQVWVVVTMLAMEGLGNLLSIPHQPIALYWLLAKCLFITGLIKAWRWVFALFLVIGGLHVIYFLASVPIASLLNAVMIGLLLSARRFYFPPETEVRS